MSRAERFAPVTASVAVGPVPRRVPDDLAPFVTPVSVDGAVVSWHLSIPTVLAAASDRDLRGPARLAASRFVRWQATWVEQFALGTLDECLAARPVLSAAGAARAAALTFRVDVVDPGDAACMEEELRRAVTRLDDESTVGWELREATTGRLLRTSMVRRPVDATDGYEVNFEPERGLVLCDRDRTSRITGWRIHGDGLAVDTEGGVRHVAGSFASALHLLAPATNAVLVEPATALDACSPLLCALAETAVRASSTDRMMIVRALVPAL
jgi:hypothetical protein